MTSLLRGNEYYREYKTKYRVSCLKSGQLKEARVPGIVILGLHAVVLASRRSLEINVTRSGYPTVPATKAVAAQAEVHVKQLEHY